MLSVVEKSYSKSGLDGIREWRFGQNWPIVYIIYNDKKAYVGETLDAVRRTEQHLQEPEFSEFDGSSICLISSNTFNKSVILDLESFLIKYMSVEGTRDLTNGNAGIVDHDYFYREAYEDDFREIWNVLHQKGIVNASLQAIENSELFKYSPYKALTHDQQCAAIEILKRISEINNSTLQSLITVRGGAGTGKTILAVYLVKLLIDIANRKKVWNTIDETEDALVIQKLYKKLNGLNEIGLVVPMRELRGTMKSVFSTVDGLDESMVLAPEEVYKKKYDVLIVDEAHRLYQRKNLPGGHLYEKFDTINRKMMGTSFRKKESDYTELDWIIQSSNIQILFYDEFQSIRVADIEKSRFDAICKPHLYNYYTLSSQMRCKGGNGYYDYVRRVLEGENLNVSKYKTITDYELRVFENVKMLFQGVIEKDLNDNLCKIVTGPGWGKEEKIGIEGEEYTWAKGREDKRKNVIFSIHKIQGFDLRYAGVIFGKEVYYDEKSKRIEINKKELMDNFTKSGGDEEMRRYILNIYITLMTRGIEGTYVYAVDERLRNYLALFFEQR